jgi:hypothetical protein
MRLGITKKVDVAPAHAMRYGKSGGLALLIISLGNKWTEKPTSRPGRFSHE